MFWIFCIWLHTHTHTPLVNTHSNRYQRNYLGKQIFKITLLICYLKNKKTDGSQKKIQDKLHANKKTRKQHGQEIVKSYFNGENFPAGGRNFYSDVLPNLLRHYKSLDYSPQSPDDPLTVSTSLGIPIMW